MMIMKLQIKLLPNLVGQPEHVPHNPVMEVMLLDHDEPTNYEEAMMSQDSAKWLVAMKSKMRSMYQNKVWTLIDLPVDRCAIKNKWILKRKMDTDSSVTIYKARLVKKGF